MAAALAGVVTLSGCGGSAVSDQSGAAKGGDTATVNIGFMAPQSGPYAILGKYLTQGVDLYLDQKGAKLGGHKLNLVRVDEGADPKTALPEVRKLLQQDKVVAVTGIINSGVGAAAAPALTEAGVPLLTTANDYAGKYDHWWNAGWGNFGTTVAMADYLAEQAKGDSVYLIASDYTGGHGVIGQMAGALKERGVKIAGETYSPYGTTKDYQPFLAKIKASGAKHVFAFYAGQEAIQFVQQYKQFGLDKSAQLYSNFALTEGVLGAERDAAEGIVTVSNYSTTLDNPANKAFVDAFTKKFNEPPTVYSEASYSAMLALDKTVGEMKGQVTGPAIQKALASMGDVDSPRGTWTFDENRGPVESFYILQVKKTANGLEQPVIKDSGKYGTRGNKVQ
jgi:branched-chain amino acid transport system substrate-binding protein